MRVKEKKKKEINLVKWEEIALPKKKGGWGIHNIFIFVDAKETKSSWYMFLEHDLWSNIIMAKYLKGITIED